MVPLFERPDPAIKPARLSVLRLSARHSDTPGDRAAHWLLTVPWSKFVATLAAFYLATASFFAVGFLRLGGVSSASVNAPSATFADAFLLSLQALSVFGCGRLAPATPAAKLLAAGAVFIGWLSLLLFLAMAMVRFIRLRPFFRPENRISLQTLIEDQETPDRKDLAETAAVPPSRKQPLN